MARSTWEGSREPEVQAEPDDAQMPCSFIISRMASPSTYSKAILEVFGKRFLVSPLTIELLTCASRVVSSLSRNSLTHA